MTEKGQKWHEVVKTHAFPVLIYAAAATLFILVSTAMLNAVDKDKYDRDQKDIRAAISAILEKMDDKFERMDDKFERMDDKISNGLKQVSSEMATELRSLRTELIQVIRAQNQPDSK